MMQCAVFSDLERSGVPSGQLDSALAVALPWTCSLCVDAICGGTVSGYDFARLHRLFMHFQGHICALLYVLSQFSTASTFW